MCILKLWIYVFCNIIRYTNIIIEETQEIVQQCLTDITKIAQLQQSLTFEGLISEHWSYETICSSNKSPTFLGVPRHCSRGAQNPYKKWQGSCQF